MKYLKNAKTAKGEHSPIKGMSKEKQPATDDQSLMDYISLISEFDFGAVEPNELNVFEEN